MNPISKFNTHYNAFKKAYNAAAQEKKNIKIKNEAISLGTKIYENPRREEIISELADPIMQGSPPVTRWHGTHYPFIEDQIDKGQFDVREKGIYFTKDIKEAQFYGKISAKKQSAETNEEPDTVILSIASNAIPTCDFHRRSASGNEVFTHLYFKPDADKPVHILEAYRKNDDEQPESFMNSALSIYQVARDTYYDEINKE